MMRRLVQRHHGNLPLDTVESIWRVIISTFTYVQAPFSVHADLSAGDALMRDSARFHFGFTVPFVPHMGAASVVEAVIGIERRSRPRSRLRHRRRRPVVDGAGIRRRAENHRPAAVRRARRSPGRHAGVRDLARRRRRHGDRDRGLERARLRLERGVGRQPRRARRRDRGARPRLRRRGLARLGRAAAASTRSRTPSSAPAPRSARAALVGSHATRYTVPRQSYPPARRRKRTGNATAKAERMTATRPQPRPGVLDIEAYVPGKSSAPGVAKVFKLSSNETPLGPSPRAIAAYKAVAAHLEDYPDGSAQRAARGDRARLRARSRPHRLRRRLRRSAAPAGARLSRRRRRGDPHHARLPDLSDRDARHRRAAGRGAGDGSTPPTSTRSSRAVTKKTQDRLSRQSEQSDRHLPLVRRGQAAASRPAAAGAAGARRRLCRIRPAQRLRSRHRARRHLRERRHDPHVLQDPRACRRCGSAGCSGPPTSSTPSTAFAARSTSIAPAIAAGIAAIEDLEHQERAREHNTRWLAWLDAGDRQARARR